LIAWASAMNIFPLALGQNDNYGYYEPMEMIDISHSSQRKLYRCPSPHMLSNFMLIRERGQGDVQRTGMLQPPSMIMTQGQQRRSGKHVSKHRC
jgi:hypothetical protein